MSHFKEECSVIFALSCASLWPCLMLKFVPVSLKLVSFAVCHDFRVSKEVLCGDATIQVGSNFLLKVNFCLLVLLLVLPAFWTSMCGCLDRPTFCLQSL